MLGGKRPSRRTPSRRFLEVEVEKLTKNGHCSLQRRRTVAKPGSGISHAPIAGDGKDRLRRPRCAQANSGGGLCRCTANSRRELSSQKAPVPMLSVPRRSRNRQHDVTERARLRHMLHKARIKCLEGGLLRKRLRAACRSQGMLGGEKIVAKTFTWRARYELLAVGLIEPTT